MSVHGGYFPHILGRMACDDDPSVALPHAAEALLTDIKSLNVNRSSWSDAQGFMMRWGHWGQWYGSCNEEDCSYSVRICYLSSVYPSFVFEEGPHLSARILELLGLRSAAVTARFDIVHGVG